MIEDELKAALAAKSLIIGARNVVRALKSGTVKQAVLASNAPGNVERDVRHYAGLGKTPVAVFGGGAAQLGMFLGKPFGATACAMTEVKRKQYA